MNQQNQPQIKDIGEQGLLKKLQKFCPSNIVGDDAAIIDLQPHQSLVVTTDILVDGVHFSDTTTSPEDAGWRACAANLSDLAAMGATPLAITVGLALPNTTPVNWVERLYQGMVSCLQQYNTIIAGGDIVRSPIITLSITAFGQVNSKQTIRRSNAQPGYLIVVTGPHGSSKAGLEILLNSQLSKNLTPQEENSLIQAHRRPIPRLDILPKLWQIIPSQSSQPIAGMDSSDGLADAVIQICQNSNLGAKVYAEKIPIHPALNKLVSPETALHWALYGGEDFELILCLPPSLAIKLTETSKNCQIIGEITPQTGIYLTSQNGKFPDRELSLNQGFQHFSV
ncbi:MAG TPA: thiamine-phosphate kinase [Halomicronema sp.]